MAYNDDILATIDRLVEEKTFSLDVLNNINELRNKAKNLQENNERLQLSLDKIEQDRNKLRDRLNILESEQHEVQTERAKQRDLVESIKLKDLEIKLVRENKDDIKSVVLAAFKNPTVKQTSFGHAVASPGSGGAYPVTLPVSNTTITEESE